MAGVGGQGILSIAKAISGADVAKGMHVKQAEVHGMSQRGGAVQSHLRLADDPIHSDLIPAGRVNLLIAIEPLEAIRYVHLLVIEPLAKHHAANVALIRREIEHRGLSVIIPTHPFIHVKRQSREPAPHRAPVSTACSGPLRCAQKTAAPSAE